MAHDDIALPDSEQLVVSSSPHYHDAQSVQRIMLTVVAALLPACAVGVWFFGLRALLVLVVCSASCVGFEAVFTRMMKQPLAVADGSALVTGVLLGMNLSPATPYWVCVVGALLAIGLGKMIYGGLGYNPFNPALVGRVGLLIACPRALTRLWIRPVDDVFALRYDLDAVVTATPLGNLGLENEWVFSKVMSTGHGTLSYLDCFIGRMGGCIGETSAAALLLGGVVLIALKLIRWQVPVAFIGTVALISLLTWGLDVGTGTDPVTFAPPQFHILTGGLFLGAFFMATDMVTSPMSASGAVVFGVGCGVLTSVIRIWGSYPEGVSFSILFMNALVPLIDRYTAARPFGARRRKEDAA